MSKATTLLRGVTEDHGLDNWHPASQASGEAGALPQEGSALSGSKWRGGDRVLPTVMFTDIVSSTEKAAALGDRSWRHLLEAHHAIVPRNLTRFRGREVQTTGDGFLATFDVPARGVPDRPADLEDKIFRR